jgi:hypothetical protein
MRPGCLHRGLCPERFHQAAIGVPVIHSRQDAHPFGISSVVMRALIETHQHDRRSWITGSSEGAYVPWDANIARINFRANCGPIAFAAVLGIEVCPIIRHFPGFPDRPWCNFTQMKSALRNYGIEFESLKAQFPNIGLALVQWLGPWTDRDFFGRNSLNYTHWIAINDSLVFDHTIDHWLSLACWQEHVAARFIQDTPGARGWGVRFGIELKNSNVKAPECASGVWALPSCSSPNFAG